jgi:hypothetical protein
MEAMIYSILSVKQNNEKLNSILTGMKGLFNSVLFPVSFNEITAIVSDFVKGSNNDINNDLIFEYAQIIETLEQQFTLLPVRFGSSMNSSDAIRSMLERNYYDIQQNLQKVENKNEFGLKVFCDLINLKADLVAKSSSQSEDLHFSSNEKENSVSLEWVKRKLKEHRQEELLLTFVDAVIDEIRNHLGGMASNLKFQKMTTEKILIDSIFLISKDQKDELIHALEYLQSKFPLLNFILTGPWPPYNFVEVKLK